MEFWGVEIKPGQTVKVPVEEGRLLHVSQAALGEHKKGTGNDPVILSLTFDKKKLVLGTLSAGNIPHISYDIVFEKDFELSHNWKNGSVHFLGYEADAPVEDDNGDEFNDIYPEEDEDVEEEAEELQLPLQNTANGKSDKKAEKSKVAIPVAKPSKPVEPKNDDSDDSEDSSDEDDDNVADPVDSGDSDGSEDSDDLSDDSDEDDMDEDEETPKKAEPENKKKRVAESASKIPVSAKKAKVATPEKTATPLPKKAVAKTPAAAAKGEKSNAPATPKSSGSIGCKSCSKKFNSDKALESHSKAKHAAK